MKSFLQSKKFFIILILVIAILFYWFGYRPSKILSECSSKAIKEAQKSYSENRPVSMTQEEFMKHIEEGRYSPEKYEAYRKRCLDIKGIKRSI